MKQYLELCKDILLNGTDKSNRTGIDTRSVFGRQLRFDLSEGFPAMTTKKLAWKAMSSELLWFIEGSGDERRLAEILHGTRDPEKKTIWTENAQADYWKPKAKFDGDCGRPYGVQWRHWKKYTERNKQTFFETPMSGTGKVPNTWEETSCLITEVDQLAQVINTLKNNPNDRRIIMTAWNPAELDQMALPACHTTAQFYVANGKLSCMFQMRSIDVFLGLPFNIASYTLLTHMIAQVSDLEVGELIWNGGDTHLYHNHFDAVHEQLARNPMVLPKLWLNPEIKDIDKFTMDDMKLIDYQSYDAIKAPMAV